MIELVNSNPYVQTNSVGNVVIEEKKSLIKDHKVWGGLGFLLGLLIN